MIDNIRLTRVKYVPTVLIRLIKIMYTYRVNKHRPKGIINAKILEEITGGKVDIVSVIWECNIKERAKQAKIQINRWIRTIKSREDGTE